MNLNFKALSISYKTSPIQVRELVALDESAIRRLLIKMKEVIGVNEILILSTCNRTEVYYSADENHFDAIIGLIGIEKGIQDISSYKSYFEDLATHEEAIQKLFDVAMGLESQVVGDLQIINQVKNAYQWAADAGTVGPFMHRLLHTIFFTNKRVVQETSFKDGAASVSYAAVEMIEELTADINNPRVLVIGVGEIGTDVVRNLQNTSITDVTITNRTFSKAQTLAEECNYKVLPFEQVWEGVKEADVVICSIMRDEPFINKAVLEKLNILNFKFLFDLSIPRSIDRNVEEIPGVLLYNVDAINNRANEALARRVESVPHVRAIITEAIAEFEDWSKEMLVSPTIQKLKNTLEQIRMEELARYSKQLDQSEIEKIDKITKNMMQKIIKLPVLQLKAACKRGEAETLVDILNDLFDLERQSVKTK